jgi:uncharacterized protein YqcC (DUF446 family)
MPIDPYEQALLLAYAIEEELKHLNRWSEKTLPNSTFENMGAFGMNTMAFEQWIQFVLLERLHDIIKTKGDFPKNSHLATYAVRNFDGDPEADKLQDLLSRLDTLIENINNPTSTSSDHATPEKNSVTERVTYDFPSVVYSLLEVLPQFTGADLESQLQTFDMFLQMSTPEAQKSFSKLLLKAAALTKDANAQFRIEEAARSVASGGRATQPYDHEQAMKEYREQHRKNYET